MKLLVISICKNEDKTIGEVLDNIPRKIVGINKIEKWVIDDGSTDKTINVAKDHGAEVISDGVNKKLAFRFREALDLALKRGADIMVNIDGDLQFNPVDIPNLVKPIIDDEADFVVADRFTDPNNNQRFKPENMPISKYLGNKLGASVVSRLSGESFSDVTCGFRAYSRKALISLNTDGSYTYTQESFQVLAMKKLRIKAIPTKVTYYKDRKSRVVTNIFTYTSRSALGILRSYRDFAPMRFFGWLGLIPFSLGLVSTLIFLSHWVVTGSFSPYKFLGFVGIYFITLGIVLWALGLVADMLSRMLSNQEKILEIMKSIKYSKNDEN